MHRNNVRRSKKYSIALFSLFSLMVIIASLPGFISKEKALQEGPIVNPEKVYSAVPFYLGVNEAMEQLDARYGDIVELRNIGESVDGHPILALGIGKGKDNALVLGGMHGREAIGSVLILNQIEEILLAYVSDNVYEYGGYQTKKILDDVSLWFVPLLNPDGAEISLNGGSTLNNQSLLKSIVAGEDDLGRWKANLNGVDLNRNFTEDEWGTVKKSGHAFYPGDKAFSEAETLAIVDFTHEMNFVGALNIHAAGEIIYWDMPYETIANRLSKVTGYSLVPPSENPPMATYDTWFLRETGNPVFTVELGQGYLRGPMEFNRYNKIWEKNCLLPIVFARELQKTQDIAIYFHGEELKLTKPTIREESGQVLVHLREVMEKIGAEVQWDEEIKMVRVSLNGEAKLISPNKPARIISGNTYIPLRGLIEAFGYKVDWDNYTKSAFIGN